MASRRPRTARFTAIAAALSLFVLVAAAASCTRVPLVAPSGTVITLISTTNTLPINGAADIIAVLIENGTTSTGGDGDTPATSTPSTGNPVHNGTLVSFSTTLGRVEPAEAKTSNGGQATVKLIADGRSGVATVTAFSGGASKTLTVNIGAAAAERILVTATPQTLPFGGGTATVRALVQDQQGNPIAGVPVSFSTTQGTLGVTTAVTDASGFATTTLATTAEATVTATAGGGTATLTQAVTITLLANSTLALTVPQTIVAGSLAGPFTVNVGTAVPASDVTISFGDGDEESLGAVTSTASTNHIYDREGSYNVVAVARYVDGTTKEVRSTVVAVPWTVSAGCGFSPVPFGATSTLTATVTPAAASIVNFSWNFGSGEGTGTGNPTQHAWNSRGTKVVTVTATPSRGPSRSATCEVIVN